MELCCTNSKTISFEVKTCEADLSLVKTVDNAEPQINSTIVYTLTLTNSGPYPTTGVTVNDKLRDELTYDPINSVIPDGTNYDPVKGLWDLSGLTIGVNDVFVLKIAAKVGIDCETFINSAEIKTSSRPDSDSTPGNNK